MEKPFSREELELYKLVSSAITKEYATVHRIANAELVRAFNTVGECINEATGNKISQEEHLSSCSDALVPVYGDYFSADNLHRMQEFALRFGDLTERSLLSAATDWEHIKVIVAVEDMAARERLVETLLRDRLTVAELTKAASTPVAAPTGKKSKKSQQQKLAMYGLVLESQSRFNPLQGNLFFGPASGSFLQLFSEERAQLKEKIPAALSNVPLVKSIGSKMDEWIRRFPSSLAYFLVQACWNIGFALNYEWEEHRDLVPGVDTFVKNVSRYQRETNDVAVTPETLSAMMDFAREMPESHLAWYLGSTAGWENVPLLLPLTSAEQQVFYAQLAARENLDAASLAGKIAQQAFEQSGGDDDVRQLLYNYRNPEVTDKGRDGKHSVWRINGPQKQYTMNSILQSTAFRQLLGE